jgi:hypothetical protein
LCDSWGIGSSGVSCAFGKHQECRNDISIEWWVIC